ncbi:hypothetical protein CTI12_AA039500 [Artemisia annua]|uniref:Uncharacterized protein n=1 Tax=Artemisia annua TaxID=35608 RepID=A0A2U1QEC3_ARTAN|nr:hypothetical protein CTI12_AA039500 [Artemisia annua]
MNFVTLFLRSFVYLMIYAYLIKYGSWHSFGLGHLICASLSILDNLKPTKSVLFASVFMGTLLVSVEDLPGKILEQAFVITMPLLLGAFVSTVVWALAAFPTPTANAPSAERLALTTVRAVTAHFIPRRGAVAGNAAEPSGSDVFGVFFSSYMVLVLYYLQCKVGSFGSSGLAHAIYLILLYLEKVKPQKHILFATVLLVTIVFKSSDHPYKILDNFVLLLTMWYTLLLTVFLLGFWAFATSTHHVAVACWRRVTYFLSFLNFEDASRNDRLVTSPARATTVFDRLDAVDSYITSSCADRALSVDDSDTFFSLHSDNAKPKRWFCCVSWCGSGCRV